LADVGNVLLEIFCVNCTNQQEALQDANVVRVGAGSNLNNVLANGVELVAEAIDVLLDLLGLGADERRPQEKQLKTALGGIVTGAEAGAAVGLVIAHKAVLWVGNGRESYQIVWQRA
jgi:hypothetical protein